MSVAGGFVVEEDVLRDEFCNNDHLHILHYTPFWTILASSGHFWLFQRQCYRTTVSQELINVKHIVTTYIYVIHHCSSRLLFPPFHSVPNPSVQCAQEIHVILFTRSRIRHHGIPKLIRFHRHGIVSFVWLLHTPHGSRGRTEFRFRSTRRGRVLAHLKNESVDTIPHRAALRRG